MTPHRMVLALVALAVLAGCSKSDHTPPSNVSGVTADGRMEMQFKWVVGKQYSMRMDLQSTSDSTGSNPQASPKQSTHMTEDYTISVVKALPDGGKELQLEFVGSKMEMKNGDRVVVNFDSSQDSSHDAGNPVAAMLRRTIGGRLKYTLDSAARVTRVDGVSEFTEHVMAGSPPQIRSAFDGMYNEGYFKQLCDVARMAPNRSVKPGESWQAQVKEDMGTIGTIVIDVNLTFKDWELHGDRKCARIESTGTITSTPAATGPDPAAPVTLKLESGTMSATGWFDPELGMTVDRIADQVMNLRVTTPTESVTNAIRQKLTFTLVGTRDVPK